MSHKSVEEAPLLRAIPTFKTIGIGRTKAYEMMNSGELPAVKVGNSTYIRRTDWKRFISSRPAYPVAGNSSPMSIDAVSEVA